MYFFQFSLLNIFYMQCIAFKLTFMWFFFPPSELFFIQICINRTSRLQLFVLLFILDLFRLLIRLRILLCMLSF